MSELVTENVGWPLASRLTLRASADAVLDMEHQAETALYSIQTHTQEVQEAHFWRLSAWWAPRDRRYNGCGIDWSPRRVTRLAQTLPGAFDDWKTLRKSLPTMAQLVRVHDFAPVTLICGPDVSGVLLAQDVSIRWKQPFLVTRRKHMQAVVEALEFSVRRGPELTAVARQLRGR